MKISDFNIELEYDEDYKGDSGWKMRIIKGDIVDHVFINDHLWDDQETFIKLCHYRGMESILSFKTKEEEDETIF